MKFKMTANKVLLAPFFQFALDFSADAIINNFNKNVARSYEKRRLERRKKTVEHFHAFYLDFLNRLCAIFN